MVLSTETIEQRYGKLSLKARIRAMIDDACDTSLIMEEVHRFGNLMFERGQKDASSRAQNRPGDGDMGG